MLTFQEYQMLYNPVFSTNTPLKDCEKMVLTVSFDDLTNPTEMYLHYMPSRDIAHGGGAVGIPGRILGTNVNPPPVFDTSGIQIGNNEMDLALYKDPTGKWLDFDYLSLTPTRNGDYLGFDILAFKNSVLGPVPVNLPVLGRASKPSPPAPPQFLKTDK